MLDRCPGRCLNRWLFCTVENEISEDIPHRRADGGPVISADSLLLVIAKPLKAVGSGAAEIHQVPSHWKRFEPAGKQGDNPIIDSLEVHAAFDATFVFILC